MADEKNLPKGWTEGTVEDLLGPTYPRRQTPEEIEEMLTPKTGPIGGETTPPFGQHVVPAPAESMQEVCDRRAAEEGWAPDWISEPIADAKALENFHQRNNLKPQQISGPPSVAAIIKHAIAMELSSKSAAEIEEMFDIHEPGAKADRGKLDYTLVPPAMEEAVCEIMMFGAQKYSRDGWRYVEDAPMRYLAALERHVKAFKAGEDNDPESGLHHLKHAACNIAFLLHFLSDGADIGYWRVLPGEDECPNEEPHYNGA
jgi:hypothetical protein